MGKGKMNLSPSTFKDGTRRHPQGDCSSGGEWPVGQGGLPWAILDGDSGTAAAVHTRTHRAGAVRRGGRHQAAACAPPPGAIKAFATCCPSYTASLCLEGTKLRSLGAAAGLDMDPETCPCPTGEPPSPPVTLCLLLAKNPTQGHLGEQSLVSHLLPCDGDNWSWLLTYF